MKTLWCRIFGHKWRRWGGQFKYTPTIWRRRLHAACIRCGHRVTEDRSAPNIQAGALSYIKGGYIRNN